MAAGQNERVAAHRLSMFKATSALKSNLKAYECLGRLKLAIARADGSARKRNLRWHWRSTHAPELPSRP
jgi:hypothetical protein